MCSKVGRIVIGRRFIVVTEIPMAHLVPAAAAYGTTAAAFASGFAVGIVVVLVAALKG